MPLAVKETHIDKKCWYVRENYYARWREQQASGAYEHVHENQTLPVIDNDYKAVFVKI